MAGQGIVGVVSRQPADKHYVFAGRVALTVFIQPVVLQVLACFPAESKSLEELQPELDKIMANYLKMEACYKEVGLQ